MTSPERIDEIFTQMDSYVLELASDPSALGPQYFQDKIAECRNYLNTVSLVTSELNRERLLLSSQIRKLEALFQLDYDNLLANDEHVRKLAAIDDRKSTVAHMLRDQRQEIDALKDELHSVEAIAKVVTLRSKELSATMTAIRDQKRLMQTEIQTGAFYGDERVPKRLQHSQPSGGLGVDDIGSEELDAWLEESEREVQAEAEAEVEADEPTVQAAQETKDDPIDVEAVALALDMIEPEIEPEVVETSEPVVSPEEAEVLNFLNGSKGAFDKQTNDEDSEIKALLDSI